MSNYFESPPLDVSHEKSPSKLLRRLKFALAGVIGVMVLLFIGVFVGLVQLNYPEGVSNDPLLAAISISKFEGRYIHLADGRRVVLPFVDDPQTVLAEGDGRLDLENANGQINAYISRKQFICGTAWARGLIRIPLIPDKVNRYHRSQVASNVKVLPPAATAASR